MRDSRSNWMGAVTKGLRCRCPRCGQGPLYRRYLTVNEKCPNCGLDLSQRPGDVLAPYVVISLVGLLLATIVYVLVMILVMPPYLALLIGLPLGLILPLAILPSVKGAVIGFQWAKGVQGFGDQTRP